MEAGIGVPQPAAIRDWFRARGWRPYEHQLAMWRAAEAGRSALLVAPTGGGKTLAGFLPGIAELATAPRPGLHTLYISPLKALAVDIHRNLEAPIAEMGLDIGVETRTGDTPQRKRERQLPKAAANADDDARIAGADAVLARCAGALRPASLRHRGRAACACGQQAGRPALARPRAARRHGAGSAADGPLGHGRGPRLSGRLALAERRARAGCRGRGRPRRRRAGNRHCPDAGADALVGPYGGLCAGRDPRRDPGAPHDHRIRQHPRPGGAHLPRALGPQRGRPRHRAPSRQPRPGAAPQG